MIPVLEPDALFNFLAPVLLCLPRIAGALLLAPFLNVSVIGGMSTRNAIVLIMGLFLYPMIVSQVSADLTVSLMLVLAVKELVLGLMLGIIPLSIFWGFQQVGALVDNQRGATAASSLNPLLGEQSSPLGTLMLQSCVFLFFIAGGFYLYMSIIYQSFSVWSVTSFYPTFSVELANFLVKKLLYSLQLCLLLASPIIIILFLTEFCMGLIGRFAPQLDVFFLSMPIKCVVAVFFLLLYWRMLIEYLDKELIVVIESVSELFTLL